MNLRHESLGGRELNISGFEFGRDLFEEVSEFVVDKFDFLGDFKSFDLLLHLGRPLLLPI